MGHRSAEAIERKAADLLRKAGTLGAPVDLAKLAAALGVQLHKAEVEDNVSGVLLVEGDERHVFVNKAHSSNRQRFSIAHELGHFVLHHKHGDRLHIDTHYGLYQRAGTAGSDAYRQPGSRTTPQQEREANQFASALLMPAELVVAAAEDKDLWDEVDVAALASLFHVSEQAMAIRLQQLGIMNSPLASRGSAPAVVSARKR